MGCRPEPIFLSPRSASEGSLGAYAPRDDIPDDARTKLGMPRSRSRSAGQSRWTFFEQPQLENGFVVGLFQRSMVEDSAMVESVLSFSQRLNIKVIAEYVENEEILIMLRNLGVPFGQGYFLGKPSPDLNFPDLDIR